MILAAYCVHNAWNCFVFLNFLDFDAAKVLLKTSDSAVGAITTLGWVGILVAVVVATQTRLHMSCWWVGAFFNILAPIIRYFLAKDGSVAGVIITNFVAGLAFGIFSTWPVMLAAMWPQDKRAYITAIASLSNYVGGALGVLIIPAVANSGPSLENFLKIQAIFSFVPALALYPYHVLTDAMMVEFISRRPENEAMPKPITEVNVCLYNHDTTSPCPGKRPTCIGTLLLAFGLQVGLALLLQGALGAVLEGAGMSGTSASIGNCLYHTFSVFAGVYWAKGATTQEAVEVHLRKMHYIMAFATMALLVLVGSGGTQFLGAFTAPLAWAICVALGVSLFAMLPFCLEYAVYITKPQSINVPVGLVYLVAMVVAALGNQCLGWINIGAFMSWLSAFMVLELFFFFRAIDGMHLTEALDGFPELMELDYVKKQARGLGLNLDEMRTEMGSANASE